MSFVHRYQLPSHPYERRPLDPFSSPDEAALLADIEGMLDVKSLDQKITTLAAGSEPAFFLVKGDSGCGLRSVANYILYRYCVSRGIAVEPGAKHPPFLVPDPAVPHNDAFQILRLWLANLDVQISRA